MPPLVQLNTPYPATAYLTGYLARRGYNVEQADVGLRWFTKVLAKASLREFVEHLEMAPKQTRQLPAVSHFLAHQQEIIGLSELALAFLRGHSPTLAHRIVGRRLFPEGPRFATIGPAGQREQYLSWAFGSLGVTDQARYLTTLFVEEICDAIAAGIDPHFSLARYGDRLLASPPTIDPLLQELTVVRPTVRHLEAMTRELVDAVQPDVVGMSLPFPGTVLGALRMAQAIRVHRPQTKIVWGGGFVNTELRELNEPRLFNFVDAVTYDDGERPLERLLDFYAGRVGEQALLRTRLKLGDEVVWRSSEVEQDPAFKETGQPSYRGLVRSSSVAAKDAGAADDLKLPGYLSLIDLLNPVNRLWSDGFWNKLTVAHGCYWKQCSFCDTTLDYIARYEPLTGAQIVDRMEAVMAETGSHGFHFVDEAAPPKVLRGLAEEILRRRLHVTYWGNVRFEKAFTPELCELLARSGCIALTGGLEASHDRLLALMHKGVTVAQVARVTHAMQSAGIRVHAYLIYGFATQTAQETLDSLEYVRQMFVAGCLDSAFWHRLSVTTHSALGQQPEKYGIRLVGRPQPSFAKNDLAFVDPTGTDHEMLGKGLANAIYNYMHGLGMEADVRSWFDAKVPRPTVACDYVASALQGDGGPVPQGPRPEPVGSSSGKRAANRPRSKASRRKR